MTDQRLRDLERDAAHGDLHAQARMLRERVRVGELAEERLKLAAYLGHEAARLATGNAVGRYVDAAPLIAVLEPWGQRVCVTASVAAIRGALTLLAAEDDVVQQDLECALCGRPSLRPSRAFAHAPLENDSPPNLVRSLRECAWRVSHACVPTMTDWAKQLDDAVFFMLADTFSDLYHSGRWDQEFFGRLEPTFPYTDEGGESGIWKRAVRSHVPRELIHWALALRGSSP